jgi:hypothetical protein
MIMARPGRAHNPDAAPPVRRLALHRFDPPREVLVLGDDGHWWPGLQYDWSLCDDGRGWLAFVTFSAQHEWGLGQYLRSLPPERIRLGPEQPAVGEWPARGPAGWTAPSEGPSEA